MYSIGLMSGTSMDGIDAALLETDGKTNIKDLGHTAINYDPRFKILLKAAEYTVHLYQGDLQQAKLNYHEGIKNYLQNIQKISAAKINASIGELTCYFHNSATVSFDDIIKHSTFLHGQIVQKLLQETHFLSKDIDVVGYHGQTLFHDPLHKISIIIGDGQTLADQVGITVINDFRSQDVANGGKGAPFAPLYHQALAMRDKKVPVAVVNCGGIANISLITGNTENDVIGFDTGPGNGLIDRYIQLRTQGKEFMDENGKYGQKGRVSEAALSLLQEEAVCQNSKNFLNLNPPKALDINDLTLTPGIQKQLNKLSLEDAMNTLETFTANTIADSICWMVNPPKYWVLAGGGWKNPVITQKLQERLREKIGPVTIKTADEFGWNSQAMEAQIFAHFAVRSLKGLPLSVPNTTGVNVPMTGGHGYLSHHNNATAAVRTLLNKNPAVLEGYNVEKV